MICGKLWGENASMLINDITILRSCRVYPSLPVYPLHWDQHIQYCANMISSGLYALNSAKHILNSCHLRMLYHTMINPYLLYGNIL